MRKSALVLFLVLSGLPLLLACKHRKQREGGQVAESEPSAVQAPTASVPSVQAPTASVPSPTAAPGPAVLEVESDPPGAEVYVGAHVVDGVLYPERGRLACTTPCRTPLQLADVDVGGGISVYLKKEGYYPWAAGLSDGRKKIEQGGVYRLRDGPFPLRMLGN
jgi:hypothetical protein